jgi:hypothetical protein
MTEDLRTTAANWINQRDAYAARYHGQGSALYAADATHMGFNNLIKGHVQILRGMLPVMNLAEMEGLAELTNALLNDMRSAHIKRT